MSDLPASDFAPLDTFPLLGRWTRRTHDLLPTAVLGTIRPLTPAAAAAIAPAAAAQCAARAVAEWQLSIAAEWDAPEFVRERLEGLGIAADTPVLVSWDAKTAVRTVWGTFARYWDAFCYPSSDDVTVWAPDGGEWTLCYRHFQVIEFGRRAPAV